MYTTPNGFSCETPHCEKVLNTSPPKCTNIQHNFLKKTEGKIFFKYILEGKNNEPKLYVT